MALLAGLTGTGSAFGNITVYDRGGVKLREFLTPDYKKHSYTPLHLISPNMVNAVIAAEDKRFYSHFGVDILAVSRASLQNIYNFKVVSGASTITQQLMRSMNPAPRTLKTKINEAYRALIYERFNTKQEILQDYLNKVSFGGNIVGIESAGRSYFNCSANNLSVAQSAALAALIKSPTKSNPKTAYQTIINRQRYILKQMLKNNFITKEVYGQALDEPIIFNESKAAFSAPQFTDYALRTEGRGKKEIYTSLDIVLQKQFEDIVQKNIAKLLKSNVTNAAVLAVHNKSGQILAWVGSENYFNDLNGGKNDGVLMLRQPGSALKPFIYALALEKGMTAADIIEDIPSPFADGFSPRNYSETYHGNVSFRTALASSYNIPAFKVCEFATAQAALNKLREFGFVSLTQTADYYGLGLALGNGEVSLYELVRAYSALANGGIYRDITYKLGNPLPQGREVLSPQSAYIITDILADNAARAPAFGNNSVLKLAFNFAAKTGTSKDYKDNYAIGFTPNWTVGVWVGNFDASPMQRVSGISGAGPILKECAEALAAFYPPGKFSEPVGIAHKKVCTQSGMLCCDLCTACAQEIFKQNNVPRLCALHSKEIKRKEEDLQILNPHNNAVYIIDKSLNREMQALVLKAKNNNNVIWHVNGEKIEGNIWHLKPGRFSIYFIDSNNNQSKNVTISVPE